MLDVNNPDSAHIFAASNQMDMLLGCAKKMSYTAGRFRRGMFHIMRPCFAALRWLQAEHFADTPQIATAIDELEQVTDRFAADGEQIVLPPSGENPTHCPVCGELLTLYGTYEPKPGLKVPAERWCSPCLEPFCLAMEKLASIEHGFATEAI